MPPRFSGTSDLSFISSEPFVVTSGSGKRFFVHSDIMRDLHLYSGSNSKEVNLSAWSDETVGRWIQFLYAGDYRVPDLVWQEAGDVKEETGEMDGEEGQDVLRPMSGRPGSITPYIQGLAAQEESLNVLLLHAGLYVLACSFGPDALEIISFDRLSSALEYTGSAIEEGNSAAAIGFVELVDYICCVTTDTLDGRIKLGTKGLDIVRNFAVKHFGTLMARAEMSSLMRKRGAFAVQLMEMVANKVRAAESDAKKWKDKARLFESALEKSSSDSKKTQQSEIRKFFQIWISRRPKEISAHSQYSQPFDLDNDALYRYDSVSLKKMKNLDFNLTRLREAHPDWTHEFESSRSREIRDSTDLETEIANYLDYCFPISLKLQTDLENYPRLREFETSEAARSLREKISARNEVQTIIPVRLQELLFLETAHKYRWLNNTCRTLHITFYDRMCFDILVHRAAWIDNRVERMEYEVNWIMKQVEDSNVGGFSDINLRD